MPRVSFLTIVNYLESLADAHKGIKDKYRWNISEISGAIRSGIEMPVKLIDEVETQTSGDKAKTFHTNTTAFTILDKPNTKTGNVTEIEAQNIVLDACQQLCFDMETRILHDASLPTINGSKNWLYGMVDKSSFHHFKIGPLFSDGLYGYRCEVSLKNQVCTEPDISKWDDLN